MVIGLAFSDPFFWAASARRPRADPFPGPQPHPDQNPVVASRILAHHTAFSGADKSEAGVYICQMSPESTGVKMLTGPLALVDSPLPTSLGTDPTPELDANLPPHINPLGWANDTALPGKKKMTALMCRCLSLLDTEGQIRKV